MGIKIEKSTSRLSHSKLYLVDGVEFWGRPELREIPFSANDVMYEITSTDRIDLIAKKFYKRPRLWWIIAHANNMTDFPLCLVPGEKIRIPDPFYVRKYILV